jgi:alpha-N-arabinofuranosidase
MNGSAMVLVRVGCLGVILWASVAFAGEPAAREPRITIDAVKTGEPISKYIYGQFIEHLGRSIYGGIWAEMLEDRKFFYPVGANESPWKPLGGAQVETSKENPFVGEHAPVVALPGDGKPAGIVHGNLGLVKGKKYAGRIWLAGEPSAGPVQVSLVWGDGPEDRQTVAVAALAAEFAKTPLAFKAGADTDDGRLEITGTGAGRFRVGTVSLMPADNVQGMRADTLAVLKELDAPVYRWPGGNFVSGYNWRDGIGDRDRRPPRKNPAWKGVEHNDFGLDEFMAFCRLLGAEPYITVNSGLGDAQSAVEELQYANGGADTPLGKLRAANGHAEPYGVRWWGIGNEMYGNWQLGHMPLEEYTKKHNQFAEAMRAVDPSIRLVAVGEAGNWSEAMMRQCADHMDLVSEHFYVGEKPDLAAHVRQVPDQIRGKADAHRRYRREFDSLKGKDIRIAMDEWNYWYGPHLYGEYGTRYFLKDALGIAAGIHEYARQSDVVFMANYAQTVNVIGCIKTTKTAAAFDTTGLVLALYRKHFGTLPVAATATAPLDAAAAFSEDRKTLTLAVVNTSTEKADVALEVQGAQLTGAGRRWEITGPGPDAYNEPGKLPSVTVSESAVRGLTDRISVAPVSVTLLALEVK